MTEYDYSAAGRARYLATQARINKWAHHTAAAPSLRSPFTPQSHASFASHQSGSHAHSSSSHSRSGTGSYPYTGSSASTARPLQGGTFTSYRPSHAGSQRPTNYGPPTHGPPPTVFPSDSISQSGSHRPSHSHHSSSHSHSPRSSNHSSHRSSHHGSSHSHGSNQPSAYIISTTPPHVVTPPHSPSGTGGVIILPRRGRAPKVVYY